MNKIIASLIVLYLAIPLAAQPGYVPRAGFVPDAATAIAVARAVLIPIYGAPNIRAEEPLVAKRDRDVWTVTGTMQCHNCLGGVAEIKISAKDGHVLHVIHGQ